MIFEAMRVDQTSRKRRRPSHPPEIGSLLVHLSLGLRLGIINCDNSIWHYEVDMPCSTNQRAWLTPNANASRPLSMAPSSGTLERHRPSLNGAIAHAAAGNEMVKKPERRRVGKGDGDRLGGVAGDGGTGITGQQDSDSLIHRVTELEIVPRETKEGFESDVVELQREKVETAVLVDALENDVSVAMEDVERMRYEDLQKKSGGAEWRESTESTSSPSHSGIANKIVQKEQAILELKNQTPACYQYVDGTDGRDRTSRGQFERMSMEQWLATPNDAMRSSGVIYSPSPQLPSHTKAFQAAASLADSVNFSGVVAREIPVLRQQHSGHDTLLLPIVFPTHFLSSLNSCVWDNNGFLHFYTIVSQMQLLEVDDAEGPAQSHIWNSRSNAGLPSQIGLRHRRHRLKVAYPPSRLIVEGFEGNLSSRDLTTFIVFYDSVTNGAFPSYVPLPEFGFVHEYSRCLIPSAQCYYGVLPEGPPHYMKAAINHHVADLL
ncbi:hypothetical protein BKA70DRAFT_1399107 [Coprinopsis sp. MPI-PUGE-AT-0042]|nr:hypothetical protein BKA70DRAFT_1399107 [Coprinopsis sp. MPI-PUGE-AT-0042]